MPLKKFSLVLLVLLFSSALTVAAERAAERVALVIGNQHYKVAPLRNPLADALSISNALTRMGFKVSKVDNANSDAFNDALDDFALKAKQAKVALIFYAGHGIQLDGKNYLIPTNVVLKSRRDLRKLINLDDLVLEVGKARQFGVVILDACRNNPFSQRLGGEVGRSVELGRGLARVADRTNNVFVGIATKAGAIAADGKGQHSPYTQGLLKNLEAKKDVRLLFGQVRADVRRLTGNQQSPDTYSALEGGTYCLTKHCDSKNKDDRKDKHNSKKKPSNDSRIGQYLIHSNGTVTDSKTQLMWKQCSEGQQGKQCTGKAKSYTWEDAMQQAKQASFAGYSDWRLPTREELRSLVYCSNGIPQKEASDYGCSGKNKQGGDYQRPTIDLKAFPNTKKTRFWSSSSYANYSGYAWIVIFDSGYDHWDNKDDNYPIRLVRSGQ